MNTKHVPVNLQWVKDNESLVPTPYHVYDEKGIRATAREMKRAFSWVPDTKGEAGGYRNFYAVKALPNPHIMKILAEEGMGFDCSSYTELELCSRIGIQGENIIFTSNNTAGYEYRKAKDMGVIINLDDISHIDFLEEEADGLPEGTPVESPVAGNIWQLQVSEGDSVEEGQMVAILESMKMEIEVTAPEAGQVIHIARQEGQQIDAGQAVMVIQPTPA